MTNRDQWDEIHENMRKSIRNLKVAIAFIGIAIVLNVVNLIVRLSQ